MLHLHCTDNWLDLFVHNLFIDSLLGSCLESVCNWYCVFQTCCVIFGICTTFSITCGSLLPTVCSTTRSMMFHWNAVNDFNDLHHCAVLHALLWNALHKSDGFLRHSSMVSHVPVNGSSQFVPKFSPVESP